jgi:sortase B
MGATATAARRALRLAQSIVDTMVLVIVILLLAVGGCALWDSLQVYRAADSAQYTVYKPTAENGGATFGELQAINPEVFGWLTVYGTNIDYPVVQGSDNIKYVNTNVKGNFSISGSIFLDMNSSKDFSDFSSIFYGHHMDKKAAFGEVGSFSDEGFFNARKYGQLYFDGRAHGLEFFAFVHADAYDHTIFRTKVPEGQQQAYLDLLLKRAIHSRALTISPTDRFVLLSTCSSSSTDGRDLLLARITDEVFDDPFDNRGQLAGPIDALSNLWGQAPLWGKIFAITLTLGLAFWLILLVRRNRHKRKEKPGKNKTTPREQNPEPPEPLGEPQGTLENPGKGGS